MDSESNKSLPKLSEFSVVEAHKDLSKPPTVTERTASVSLGPITPDCNKEIGEFPIDFLSPLSLLNKPPKVACFDSSNTNKVEDEEDDNDNDDPFACVHDCSPQTPKDGVFDPFAPGPDNMALAPISKKYFDESRPIVARRLNFDSSIEAVEDGTHEDAARTLSDKEMLESLYQYILEVIETESVISQVSNVDWDSDGCKTPPSAPRINEIADTCPAAPMKPSGISRNIDFGLCRKLEF